MEALASELAAASSLKEAGNVDSDNSVALGMVDSMEPPSTPHELAKVVRALTQQLLSSAQSASEGEARMCAMEERLDFYEKELRRATVDANALRERVRERKRENEKLTELLEQERDANSQAQVVISDLRDRLASGNTLPMAPAPGGTGPSAGRLSMNLGGGPTTTPADLSLSRTASLAGRASFAAMTTPTPLARTSSRSLPATSPINSS
jgi:hypothetical protein